MDASDILEGLNLDVLNLTLGFVSGGQALLQDEQIPALLLHDIV